MARHLQLLPLLSRMAALSVTPTVSTQSRGCFGRGGGGGGGGKAQAAHGHLPRASNRAMRYNDEECDDVATEEVEDKLQELMNKEMKRKNTVKYYLLRKKMTQPGPPERKLTWQAMEQIRYLKQEQPEEWTVERLAEGFSVSPDVILRVLRSKFTPAVDRKAKQDTKVVAALGQQKQMLPTGAGTGQGRLRLPANQSAAAITPGSRESAVVPVADGTRRNAAKNSVSLIKHSAPARLQPTQFNGGIREDATEIPNSAEDRIADTDSAENSEDDDESWDGQVFLEEDLEEFIEMKKPSPPVQVGNDFFDSEGNFLYRI